MDGTPVFSMSDLTNVIDHLLLQTPVPTTVDLVLAPEHCSTFADCPSPLHLCMHDLHHICALQSISGEGMTVDAYHISLDAFASDLTDIELLKVIH